MRQEELRALQKIEYMMLKDITDFCDQNNIIYFLDSGTLLGAVRHGGFIPWDDDIDICMDVENYKKFIKLSDKLSDKYFFQNYRTDPKVNMKWSKIRINGTTSMERNMSKYGIHYGICMDIFVYVGLSENIIKRKVQNIANKLLSILLEKHYCDVVEIPVGKKVRLLYKLMPEKMRIWICRFLEYIVMVDTNKTKYCYNNWYSNPFSSNTVKFPSDYYKPENRVKIKFEDDMFWGPKEYISYLELMYGEWWKYPPENERNGHGNIIVDLENDYTFYQKSESK